MNSNENINSSVNQKLLTVIEDFIDVETATELLVEILNRKEPDRREHYEFLGLGNGEVLFQEIPFDWDPKNIIKDTGLFAFNFFKNMYNLDDNFVLNRIFGNVMNPKASLDTHKDLSYDEEEEHDNTKKTFACGLFLSDDYEGGNFTFFKNSNISFKPKAGSLVLFNGHSTWHGVDEVLQNSRVNILYMFYYTNVESA